MLVHRERRVAAHRQAADDGVLLDVELVEQVDGVAGIVVDRRRRRVALAVTEAPQLRHDDAPSAIGERTLRLPHRGGEREAVNENQRARAAALAAGRHVEIAEPSDLLHWASLLPSAAVTAAAGRA